MKCRRFRCPACGWFGRKARRRAADTEAQSHIAWAASLLALRPSREPLTFEQAVSVAEAVAEIAAALAIAPDCEACPEWVPAHPVGTCFHARMEAFDARLWPSQRDAEARADEIAEVVGPLSYEEQSEMFGDPIADVIRRETP
ncbi:hypothetical protein SEA_SERENDIPITOUS_95 [Mycobacterium phage Serendipitous]|uniref:Uncharacterized protein n=1 Tax=Mycobacterium phage Serendipitous TaxID=2301619 RepID=A0A385UHI8_9CAUD|nr:hypothetical protein I5G64_gp95 [Mycobacterium phage Serendipitous]AYB70636.1 hypothetical protein SEA_SERENDIPITOUS_95 [Mycobacterium phage Serendipitous]